MKPLPIALRTQFDATSFSTELQTGLRPWLPPEKADPRKDLSRYREDPVGYVTEFLGLALTDAQQEMLRSLVMHRRTAAKASHAVGKTFVAALAACWWYDCWPEHIVYITAPTWKQALGLTFKTIARIRRKHWLSGQILETGLIRDKDPYLAGAHFIRALNAENGEGFQGEHTADILLLYEEAVGVPGYIWESGDGLMTSHGCRLLAVANPTNEATPFGQACASEVFNVITISGMKHPNVAAELAGQPIPFPGAVTLTWIVEMLEKECERSPTLEGDCFEFPLDSGQYWLPNAVFQGRVLGEFPSQADEQVIPRSWLTSLPRLVPGLLPAIGCDVARHGTDRTTIASGAGPCVLSLMEIRKLSLAPVTGALKGLADVLAVRFKCNAKKIPIKVDVTGGLGAGPVDFLLEQGYNAIGINSSSKAIDLETYPNKRSELWFVTRDRARTRDLDLSRLPAAMRAKLERELSTPKWAPDSRGRKVVEDKKTIKARLGASPDLADAVNLLNDAEEGNWEDAVLPPEEMALYESEALRQSRNW